MRYGILLASTLTFLLSASLASAQHNEHELGEVDFPVSCNSEAQAQTDAEQAQRTGNARAHDGFALASRELIGR